MTYGKIWTRTMILLVLFAMPKTMAGQVVGGDILNEAPLSEIPADMTFEEYRDMNRRLTVGLLLAAIPIPGMIHFYAGEKRTGRIIAGTVAVGVVSIIAGAAGSEKGSFPDSDFDLIQLNSGTDDERRYEKIPTVISAGDTTFLLHEIFKKTESGQPIFLIAGVGLIAGSILYDFVHGITTIERKRDAVRFKYGQLISGLSVRPQIDARGHWAGLTLSIPL